jgi:hypothetical protein
LPTQRSLVNQTRAARFGGAFAFLPSHHSPRKTPAGFISSPPGGERWEAMAGWGPSRLPTCGPWGRGVALERELSRDGSHYSISSGILPSLGARSNRRAKLRPFIVSPYDRRYRFAASSSLLVSSRPVLPACAILPTGFQSLWAGLITWLVAVALLAGCFCLTGGLPCLLQFW